MSFAIKRWLLFAVCLATAYGAYKVRRTQLAASDESQQAASEPQDALLAAQTPGGSGAAKSHAAPGRLVAPFTLTDQDEKPFDTASLKGRVWVASFFFTSCPSICIRLNQTIAALIADQPESDAHFVSITCDPDNDTPEVLRRYGRRFKADPARWTFLTGDIETIKRIGLEEFQVSVLKEVHSDRTFAVDRSGRVRGRYRITEPDDREKLARLLKTLEAEPAPTAEQATEQAAGPAANGAEKPIEQPAEQATETPNEQPNQNEASAGEPALMMFESLFAEIHPLATVNAALNATATVLLVAGYVLIKLRREKAHKWVMLTAFGVSIVFLACYLTYHFQVGSVKFSGVGAIASVYYTILLTHVILAATVPFLAARTIYLGLKDRRAKHKRWAWWTFPIWLYVSVTGVVIYALLYHIYPGPG